MAGIERGETPPRIEKLTTTPPGIASGDNGLLVPFEEAYPHRLNCHPIFGQDLYDLVQQVTTTCLSSPQCGHASPCVRGECRDLWNTFTCICPLGFGGRLCEINLDDCSRIYCGKGHCVDGIGEARMALNAANKHVEMAERVKTRTRKALFVCAGQDFLGLSVKNAKIPVKTDLVFMDIAKPRLLNLNVNAKRDTKGGPAPT
ncbi:EGF-like domain protein [Ancylostoma duodenale]|uniref:EGF-like domain protein n=1 Tax=Ancylostoma duodenale TaxID=51022 RepID=A0A0C2HIK2_9BILA|nr:EGF-like domain protein [Ancylostoma duodenale]